jgi:hypothetical protein
MNEAYTSPVAIPIVTDGADDYRTWRENRKWLVSVLVNGKRYFLGKTSASQKVGDDTITITGLMLYPDILNVVPFDTYPQARHEAAIRLLEPTGNDFEMRCSAALVKRMLGLDITPRVKIEIAMVETTEMEPAWRTAAYRIMTLADVWHTQYWPGI